MKETDWIEVGVGLIQKIDYERDYFLPVPAEDLKGFKKKAADYATMSCLTKITMSRLEIPVRNSKGAWTKSGMLLFQKAATLFWTEHSDRHFVPSVAAALGADRDDVDVAGRWGVNKG